MAAAPVGVVGGASLVGDHAGEDAAVVHLWLMRDDPLDRESVRDETNGELLE